MGIRNNELGIKIENKKKLKSVIDYFQFKVIIS